MRLIWLDSMSVGIVQMDEQHRNLIASVNALRELPPEALGAAARRFARDALAHIRDEEALLARLGFVDLPDHAALHRSFMSDLRHWPRRLTENPGLCRRFGEWASARLVDQLIAEDMNYKSFAQTAIGREHGRCACMDQPGPPGLRRPCQRLAGRGVDPGRPVPVRPQAPIS